MAFIYRPLILLLNRARAFLCRFKTQTFSFVSVSVIDNEDGTHTVSYQPIVRGNHQITITMRNCNINGSPFSVNVTGRMDFAKVGKVMACFGCEGTGGGKKTWHKFQSSSLFCAPIICESLNQSVRNQVFLFFFFP